MRNLNALVLNAITAVFVTGVSAYQPAFGQEAGMPRQDIVPSLKLLQAIPTIYDSPDFTATITKGSEKVGILNYANKKFKFTADQSANACVISPKPGEDFTVLPNFNAYVSSGLPTAKNIKNIKKNDPLSSTYQLEWCSA